MSAYMLAFVRFKDFEAYSREYLPHAHAIVTRYGGQAVAVSENVIPLEGALPGGRAVIVEFPTMEAAKAFYDDPEYQPLKAIRQRYCDSDAVIFDKGFEPMAN